MSIRWNLKFALGALGFIATCLAATHQGLAKGEGQVWKEYVYPVSGFAVMAPTPPREQDVDYFRIYEFGLDSDLHLRLEVLKGKEDCVGWVRWATQHNDSKHRKLVSLAGHTALETWMQRPIPPNPSHLSRLFLIRGTCINSTSYIFAGDWPTDVPDSEFDAPRPEIVTRIFDSFRIIEKETAGGR